ncbi:hypothetical protein F3Y22_tig00112761pilonHSYRG00017 [Hibiscus syriacus]|uniref:Uncharacterized protein n=1 Tax=Hibiscus syriacus TaxID=106335 RepID=A0A6A2WTB7_HIBSY|nr:hypothetical protein F3Y22_tig00112761pilonHSYRG00017 [Hibiscus syriacus]
MKKGSDMRVFQDLETLLKRKRDLTGKFERISTMISSGNDSGERSMAARETVN